MSQTITYTGNNIPTNLDLGTLLSELKAGLGITEEEAGALGISYNPGGGTLVKRGSLENSETIEEAELVVFNIPDLILESDINTIVAAHIGSE